jgi:SAM-dependent methyltransferase
MKPGLLDLLLCPACGAARLAVSRGEPGPDGDIREGAVACGGCGTAFPVEGSVLSFRDAMPEQVRRDGDYWGTFYQWHEEQGFTGYTDPDGDLPLFPDDRVGGKAPRDEQRLHILEHLFSQPGVPAEGRVLDIGAGGGWTSLWLARRGYEVVALDPAVTSMRIAKRRADTEGATVECLCGSADTVRFREGSFDILFSFHALHHIPDLLDRMPVIRGWLREGGLLIADEHIQNDLLTGGVAAALMTQARESEFPTHRGKAPAPPHPPGVASANEDCSAWAVVPATERCFTPLFTEYRLTAFDRLPNLCYLSDGRSMDAAEQARRIGRRLADAFLAAAPERADCVSLIGRKEGPSREVAARFFDEGGMRRYRTLDGRIIPAEGRPAARARWWQLPGRAWSIFWHRGPAALLREVKNRRGRATANDS